LGSTGSPITRLFYYAINYDTRLIWLNLFLLFFIALMPLPSSIYGIYNLLNTSLFLYTGNIVMLGLFNYLLFSRISNPAKNLSHGLENRRLVTYYKLRSWVTPCCFGIGILITLLFEGQWAIMCQQDVTVPDFFRGCGCFEKGMRMCWELNLIGIFWRRFFFLKLSLVFFTLCGSTCANGRTLKNICCCLQ
jgi:hypothetical protein